mmetsp:Transcript_16500/g.29930  ORF Transcript_16500/g.29930 Transcript_16500/m.29930 type:complete len:114 (-) Transcript_16500:410-751(-)
MPRTSSCSLRTQEIREFMAHLGYSKFEDLIRRADLLKEDSAQLVRIAKTKGVSLSGFFSSIPDSKGDHDFLRATPAEGGARSWAQRRRRSCQWIYFRLVGSRCATTQRRQGCH